MDSENHSGERSPLTWIFESYYQSQNSWRSAGDLWCYEYQLKPAGILRSPEVYGGVILDGSGRQGSSMEHISDRS